MIFQAHTNHHMYLLINLKALCSLEFHITGEKTDMEQLANVSTSVRGGVAQGLPVSLQGFCSLSYELGDNGEDSKLGRDWMRFVF